MRVVFMGTPDFSVPALEKIAEKHEVTGVVTQQDRPKGRGHKKIRRNDTFYYLSGFGTEVKEYSGDKSQHSYKR